MKNKDFAEYINSLPIDEWMKDEILIQYMKQFAKDIEEIERSLFETDTTS